MADQDRYPNDERGYERGRQWNRADHRDDYNRDRLDDRNGYGEGSPYGAGRARGLYSDSYGNYGGGGADYDIPRYSRDQEDRAFGPSRRPRPSPRGGLHAYGAEDSGRGYQYDPYLDRNQGYESRPFNPYSGEYGGLDHGAASFGPSRHGRYGGSRHDRHRSFWDRAMDEVSSWMGDRDALERRMQDDRASHAGKGPKGYRRSDDRIRDDVSDRLSDDHWLDASDIEVKVDDGEVTLSGTVSHRDAKRRAEHLADSARGVRDVHNRIKVASPENRGPENTGPENTGMGINTTLDKQAAGRA